VRLGFGNGDPAVNGECRLLEELAAAPVEFDVGAHHGDYAAAVFERRPNATVYGFGPSAGTFEILAARVGSSARLHRVAPADQSGARTLYADRMGSSMASLFRRELGWLNLATDVEEKVETRTLDDFCVSEGLDQIDLLKIDAEGAECLVLLGAQRMLAERRIARIMFECGGPALDSHFFMRAFFNLLDGHAFYRVFPDGLLPLGSYREQLEVPQYANYVAIPSWTT
jgi:FkbM family methyltransferase